MDFPKCVDHFSEKANKWPLLYKRAAFRDRLKLFVRRLSEIMDPPADVLDFGCGSGTIAMALAEMGYNVTGLDAAEGMIEVAERERRLRSLENVSFNLVDMGNLSIDLGSYDAVICSSVIEYIEEDWKLLNILVNALRDKGILLISIPHRSSFIGKIEDVAAYYGLKGGRSNKADLCYSKRRYDQEEFLKMLRRLSLTSFDLTYFEFPWIGKLGIPFSRLRYLSLMLLIRAIKCSSE